jgi:cytochrome c biogenesis protein CcdA/thiol-disulfide isomerase/thioredoxin
MVLFLLVYLGGVLTIVSPCILPVLPFVFARADRPFVRSGLPLLFGMAATFALVATLAAVGGGWAVSANEYGRGVAIALLAFFGVTLLIPELAARIMQPLVALGARLSRSTDDHAETLGSSVTSSLGLGVATGLLWAPCAGPVLGLILTGAALEGANARTSLLLLAYAAGAATSLALALLVGGRVFAALKRSLGFGEWIRRGVGVAVLAAVVAIAFGLDTGFLTRVSLASTSSVEQRLLDRFHPASRAAKAVGQVEELTVEGPLPSLAGAVEWLNSAPLTAEALRGKVVLVDFWTYSCINCLRAIPYVRAWDEKYRDQGLVVIGVHAPEFAFEKNIDNVRKAVADLEIRYPVSLDNNYTNSLACQEEYRPAIISSTRRAASVITISVKVTDGSERVIQQLLKEAGTATSKTELVSVRASGAEAAPDLEDTLSPETYVGYGRAEHFVSPGGVVGDRRHADVAGTPRLNEWGLSGFWTIRDEDARLDEKDGRIVYRFHARDLHLVLGPTTIGTSVRFRLTIDGAAPGKNHGVDVDADGNGVINEQRLYQLIRQTGVVRDRTFEIRFLTPGVQVYAFTFG